MNLQVIKSIDGKAEYVLLPIHAYKALKQQIVEVLEDDYVPFVAEDYISNPIALARINAGVTQKALARLLGVTQAYISKLEAQSKVSAKALKKAEMAIASIGKKAR